MQKGQLFLVRVVFQGNFFTNVGYVNRHNSYYWSKANPHWYDVISHQRSVMNVWYGIVNKYISPHFLNDIFQGAVYNEFLQKLSKLLENVDLINSTRKCSLSRIGHLYIMIVEVEILWIKCFQNIELEEVYYLTS